MNEAQQHAWKDFEQLFIAAFDNPIARRRHQDEYAIEAREAFHRLRRLIQPFDVGVPAITDFLLKNGIPSTDTIAASVGGIAATLMPNQEWMQEAISNGMAATSEDAVALIGGVTHATDTADADRDYTNVWIADGISCSDALQLDTVPPIPSMGHHTHESIVPLEEVNRMTRLIATDPKMK